MSSCAGQRGQTTVKAHMSRWHKRVKKRGDFYLPAAVTAEINLYREYLSEAVKNFLKLVDQTEEDQRLRSREEKTERF